MRSAFALLISFLITACNCDCDQKTGEEPTDIEVGDDTVAEQVTYEYDADYAAKLGADDYGMKSYVMAFLKSGPNRPDDPNVSDSLQSAHLANIHKLAEEGKLVLAGPFFGGDNLKGIYVFNTDSLEEAAEWTSTDPAIIYGSLEMELKKWYGSAALMDVNHLHKKAAKIDF